MLSYPSRDFSRRQLLGGGLTALGAALVLPRSSLAASDVSAVTALTFDGDELIVMANTALWRVSSDGAEALPTPPRITQLTSHPARAGTVYAVLEGRGLTRSDDGGRRWANADTGLPATRITAFAIAALEPEMLYAAVEGDGLWRSQDGGNAWEFVMDRPYLDGAEHEVLSLISVGNPTGMGGIWLYGGTRAGLSRVPDCFCRWQDVTAGDAMDALVAGKTPPPAKPLPAGTPVTNLALAPETPERLYAGLESGLWTSGDGGVNWSRASAGPVGALAVNPADPLHLAAAREGGLSISRDGGVTWTSSNSFKET